jgi:antitoxin component YwqK of YwqJK toxin-antitoxin module
MKWYLYILIFVAVACNSKATITEDEIGSDIFYAKGSYRPYTGKCIVVFNNTSLVKEKFTFKNGVLQGEAMAWYINGQIRRRGHYNRGQISGKWEFWDENGNLTMEANYEDNILNGSYIALYTSGKVKEKGQFSANRRTGKWTLYSEDGQLIRSEIK